MASVIMSLRDQHLLRISHFIHLRAEICSETLIEELDEFRPEDRIGIVSLMDHTPGQRQFRDPTQHRIYLSGRHGMTSEQIDHHFSFMASLREEKGEQQLRAAVAQARELGAVLASHDDTTVEHVEESQAYGVGLAEFPTTLEAARALVAAGIAVMMGAPNLLRGASHSGNVAAQDLAEQGCLDILSSDYAPSSLLAGAVVLGLEAGNMADGIRRVTAAPAAVAGLADRGVLRPGLRGDLARFAVHDRMPVPRAAWVRGVRTA